MEMDPLFLNQKRFFATGRTRAVAFRMEMLSALESAIVSNESRILEALNRDLRKPVHEAWMSEIGVTLEEIRLVRKNLPSWARAKRIPVPLPLQPGRGEVRHEPLGVTLIIGPWNYPFQLAIAPLIGAIAAGNCAVLKPSELTANTSSLLHDLVASTFSPDYITVVEGGIPETTALLKLPFDHIFFTGSTAVGKIVMQAAAKNLVPVTLELGGKSPVIVDQDADLDLAARRIIWGKLFNAGQTCVAPDYLYVHESVREPLLSKMAGQIRKQLGPDEQKSPCYARILNERNYNRIARFISSGEVYYGGRHDAHDLYIQPTILSSVAWEDPVMNEEIFGPILPVLTYKTWEEVVSSVRARPKPLAAYLFSQSKTNQNRFLDELSFGGGCINDVMAHLGNPHMPFGGVGESGMGHYHGHSSFLTFSHAKAVLRRTGWLDLSARYAPYTESKTRLVRWLFGR